MSETIDLFSGSSGEPEESPGPSRSAGQPAGVAPAAGTSPAQTGAVRSRPGADDGTSAATQPDTEAALWNPKGYVNNARPRVRVRAVAA